MVKIAMEVSGHVQGVGFRFSVVQLAHKFGPSLKGSVWNNNDGTVGIHAQCDDVVLLDDFIAAIKKGPSRWCRVDKVTIHRGDFPDYDRFEEHYTW